MTSQKDIQSLIAAIDDVMPKAGARLPWLPPSAVASQRRVLEQVRSYLVSQQEKVENSSSPSEAAMSGQEAALMIASTVVQEINSLGTNLIQPLQAEILALRQQRESLIQEIRQLEMHRHYYESLAQQQDKQQQIIEEFLQALLGRLQESLTKQITQSLANLEAKFLSEEDVTAQEKPVSPAQHGQTLGVPLHPSQRLEELRQLQVHSDQILITLDLTLQTVFEALQRNIQGYEQSLSQGIEKMHDLALQNEVMFTQLFSRLARSAMPEPLPAFKPTAPHLAPETSTTSAATTQTTPDTLQPPPKNNTTANSATSTLNPNEIDRNFYSQETSENLAGDEDRSLSQQEPVNASPLPYPGTELRSPSLPTISSPFPNIGNGTTSSPEPATSTESENLHPNEFNQTPQIPLNNLSDSADTDFDEIARLYKAIFVSGSIPVQEIQFQSEALILPSHTEVSLPEVSAKAESEPVDVLFTQEAAASTESSEKTEEPEDIETIFALTDLFPETPPLASSTPTPTAANGEKIQTQPDLSLPQPEQQESAIYYEEQLEDIYIPASPEEDLLASDRTLSKLDITLWQEETIIQQLSEDFSSFEAAVVTQNVEVKSQKAEIAAKDSQMQQPADAEAIADRETQKLEE